MLVVHKDAFRNKFHPMTIQKYTYLQPSTIFKPKESKGSNYITMLRLCLICQVRYNRAAQPDQRAFRIPVYVLPI